MDNINNIADNLEQKMVLYNSNLMSLEERYAFEKELNESAFLNDATEGLAIIKDTNKLKNDVAILNEQLNKITKKNKNNRVKRKLEMQDWIIVTIVLILILLFAAYTVVKLTKT